MDFLYSTTITLTYEEYRRFELMLLFNRSNILWIAIPQIWCWFLSVLIKSFFCMVISIIHAIIILILLIALHIYSKKIWEADNFAHNMNIKLDFYDGYLVGTDKYGETRIEYNKLHKIIETKTNFYLMTENFKGIILNKSNFPEGLADFLKNLKIS